MVMDPFCIKTFIQALITMILKNSIINWLNHSRIFCGFCQLEIMRFQFIPQKESFFLLTFQAGILIHLPYFLDTGLYREISLPGCYNLFRWICILNNKVTC